MRALAIALCLALPAAAAADTGQERLVPKGAAVSVGGGPVVVASEDYYLLARATLEGLLADAELGDSLGAQLRACRADRARDLSRQAAAGAEPSWGFLRWAGVGGVAAAVLVGGLVIGARL